jgi:tetratricopeptide (TPR) repeat protein/predicted O-methyltransferase YrrM
MDSRKEDIKDEIKRVEELTKDVYGAISLHEARFLYYLAKEGPGEGVIVEIGSFCGYSTIWLACGSKWAEREKVYAIDPQNDPLLGDNEVIFKENIKKTGVKDWVIPLIMTSEEAAKNWNGDPIRLLFIDGNHEYEYVRKDFVLWNPYLIDGGVIVFHDYFSVRWPGVLKCVNENIFHSDKFGELGTIDSILYAFKKNELTPFERMKKENFLRLLTPHQKIIQSAEDMYISFQEGKFDKVEERFKEIEGMIYTLDKAFSDYGKVNFYSFVQNFLVSQGRYNEAESKYKEVLLLEEIPVSWRFHAICGLANLYTQQGKHKDAESKYKEALSMEIPNLERSHAILSLANLYTQQEKHNEAESKYKEALSIEIRDPQRFHAICGLANLYTQQGKHKDAESKYKEALSMEIPNLERSHAILSLANLYTQQGKHKEAESKYNEALSIEVPDPQRFHAICGLANLYTQQGKHKDAESKYKEALSLEIPNLERFHAICGLANLYTQQGKHNEAETKYKEALLIEGLLQRQRLNVFCGLGNLYIQQQRYKEAEERLDQALSLADSIGSVLEAANIHYNKGSMYEKRELFDKAKKEFEATLTLIKDATSLRERELKGGACFHLGCIYKREDDKRAESFFKECLLYIPNHKKAKEELLSYIGLTSEEQEKVKERLRHLGYL